MGLPLELDEETLRREESVPLASPVTLALARRIGARAQELGESRGLPIALTVRLDGRTVFQVALDGSAPINDVWMMKKIRVAESFQQSTLLVQAEHVSRGHDFYALHGGTPDYWAPAGGGLSLRDGTMTFRGVLIVSGLTQVEDHLLGREVLADFS